MENKQTNCKRKTVKESIRDVLFAMKNANFLDLTAAQLVYQLDGDDIQAFCDYYNIYPSVMTHGNWRLAQFHKKDTDETLTGDDYKRMMAELESNEETEKEIEHHEQEEVELKYEQYGWLSPDGSYYPAEWCEHTEKATELAEVLYKGSFNKREHHAPDFLCGRGWVLLHNPSGGSIAQVTARGRGEYRLTKKQIEFLYDYYLERGLTEFSDYYAKQL